MNAHISNGAGMKRSKIYVGIGIAIVIVAAILWNNKSIMQAKARTATHTTMRVSVARVKTSTLSQSLSLVGTIVANNDVAIVSETQGRVTVVNAEVGQTKNAGSTLVQVDEELKKSEFIKAEVNYERAKRDAERYAALRSENATTEWQKDNAWQAFKIAESNFIKARKEFRDTKITTPISGIVTARTVDVGAMVQPGMVVANVIDISRLKVKLNIAESDVFKLKVGDPVDITTDVYPGRKFSGKVTTISAKADESHTYPVEIGLPNSKDQPLKAGMFGRVHFTSTGNAKMLSVPRIALIGSVQDSRVFVVENNIVTLRTIVVGDAAGNDIAVLQGLREGEAVVVNGQNNLKDGEPVEVVDGKGGIEQ